MLLEDMFKYTITCLIIETDLEDSALLPGVYKDILLDFFILSFPHLPLPIFSGDYFN